MSFADIPANASAVVIQRRQREFVADLIAHLEHEVIQKIIEGKVPLEWDGIELRQYVADRAADANTVLPRKDMRRRRMEYRKTVLINNL